MSVFPSRSDKPARPAAPNAAITVVAGATQLQGDLDSDGVIQIEGRVEGTVWSRATVFVTGAGAVTGDIHATEIVIAGRVEGDLHGSERIELKDGGTVHGDVTAPRVAVLEGGELNGRLKMEKTRAAISQAA